MTSGFLSCFMMVPCARRRSGTVLVPATNAAASLGSPTMLLLVLPLDICVPDARWVIRSWTLSIILKFFFFFVEHIIFGNRLKSAIFISFFSVDNYKKLKRALAYVFVNELFCADALYIFFQRTHMCIVYVSIYAYACTDTGTEYLCLPK